MKKYFWAYAVLAVTALLAFEYSFWSNGFTYLEEQSKQSFLTQTELLEELLVQGDTVEEEAFEAFAEESAGKYQMRITIIDDKGQVLGESDQAGVVMNNHLDREEVKRALAGESNSLIRKSETFGVDYCYCAVPIQEENFSGVLRAAVPLERLYNMQGEFFRSTVLAMLVLLLLVAAIYLSFRQYVKAMKKVENMRKEFVSNVTHELKTPLTSIRGFVETLQDGAIEDPVYARKFLGIIDQEAERLTNLINDTLLLSEIESKADTKRISCDMNALIQEVVELLQPRVKEHVRLIFRPGEKVPPFLCNPDRIKELLINLIDNALKATEFGAVTVSLRKAERYLILEVADTGIGMEEEQLERIFERFYRVDKGRSKAQGGTGLGLSIVKHIVENYHGSIEVKSKPGVGTEFLVKLPCETENKVTEK